MWRPNSGTLTPHTINHVGMTWGMWVIFGLFVFGHVQPTFLILIFFIDMLFIQKLFVMR